MLKVLALLIAPLAFGLTPPASATYSLVSIDLQNSTSTDVRGINNTGQIVGYVGTLQGVEYSFVYSPINASFNPLPLPAPVLSTYAMGINDAGKVVGGAYNTGLGETLQGFTLAGGTYNYFLQPGWSGTEARGINNAGLVTGWSQNVANGQFVNGAGFIYDPGPANFTPIAVGGAIATIAQGINSSGQVVGSSYTGYDPIGQFLTGQSAFLRQPDGTIESFRINGVGTGARGINNQGVIAGFVGGNIGAAFVGNSLGYELLRMPGAVFTGASGINDAGQVVGLWQDVSGNYHGWIGTPVVEPTGTTVNGAYTFDVVVVPSVPIFIDPLVAIGYDYAIGAGDPFFGSVRLPIGIGDSLYTLIVGGQSFTLAGGDLFDFTTHGFANGVAAFEVGGIEVDAGLDPANPLAFATELTFLGSGRFTGTMTPIAVSVPEPDSLALFGLAFTALILCRRRRAESFRPTRRGSIGQHPTSVLGCRRIAAASCAHGARGAIEVAMRKTCVY
jgi:uncharacterized membrane protein